MGAFFMKKNTPGEVSGTLPGEISELFARQGFGQPEVVSNGAYSLFLYAKQIAGEKQLARFDNGDFCACTGTLIYAGETGVAALRLLYRDFSVDQQCAGKLYGAFCVILRKDGESFLFIDRLGVYDVFRGQDETVWSSSFLAVLSSLQESSINSQALYEYVFQGATYGYETVIREIGLADPDWLYRFSEHVEALETGSRLTPVISEESQEAHLERNLANLRSFYQSIAHCYADNIDTALSGGYDSRLTLALLQEQGVMPQIHVYGRPADADVTVALDVGRGEQIDIRHIDKSGYPEVEPADFKAAVEANFYAFDGYPTDGVFRSGSDLATRRDRCGNGNLMLNGGGGEVFRNFFYLRDTSYTVQQLLWSFYSQFDPEVCTSRFSETEYHGKLGEKVKAVLGIERYTLRRAEIELLYATFRCRFWMGRNNSLNNRFGHALTPFIDYAIVKDSVRVPLKYKNFGKFESSMIRTVSPSLAAYGSAYGHNFMADPPASTVAKELATYYRPAWLRRYSFRIQHRHKQEARTRYLQPPYLAEVLPDNFDYMGKYMHVNKLKDNAQFNRACTLEYLFRNCSPSGR